MKTPCVGVIAWLVVGAATVSGQDRVVDTVHNLSASGPGPIRAVTESQVCVFCHAPHNTQGVRPLWNQDLPAASYRIYRSTTLDALPGQPTGSSKLCLSCHDGTIALGSVLSRADQIRMVGGDFIPVGPTHLGTDLADDHPVSFHYTSGLAATDHQLASPTSLPSEVRLDASGQMQCTSCHDPHHNLNGDFLVRRPEFGELCMACHDMDGWNACRHRTSNAALSGVSQASWPFDSVAENACRSCHRPHTAGGEQRLLLFANEEENCLVCHSGPVAAYNIAAEINKFSGHDPRDYLAIHDAAETGHGNDPHVECTDCHNNDTTRRLGGGGPDGPHGSNNDFLLARNYTVADDTSESHDAYSMCYQCHLRSSILNDESFPEHKKHIEDERTPCSACHDPHGVPAIVGGTSDRTHLINFDRNIVFPNPQNGRLEFRDNGRFAGSCTLVCHGEQHNDEAYPDD